MAAWPTNPEWINVTNINNGEKYDAQDGITYDVMNIIVQNLEYLKQHSASANYFCTYNAGFSPEDLLRDEYKVGGGITVNVSDPSIIHAELSTDEEWYFQAVGLGLSTITLTFFDEYAYDNITVSYVIAVISRNVLSLNKQYKTVTPKESHQYVYPDSGYDGLGRVSVEAVQTEQVTAKNDGSYQEIYPSTGKFIDKVIVPKIEEIELATPTQTVDLSSGRVYAQVNQTTGGFIKSDTKSSYLTLNTAEGATITPGVNNQIAIKTGYLALGNIEVAGDTNLKAENIKNGVSIFGVVGTFVSEDVQLPQLHAPSIYIATYAVSGKKHALLNVSRPATNGSFTTKHFIYVDDVRKITLYVYDTSSNPIEWDFQNTLDTLTPGKHFVQATCAADNFIESLKSNTLEIVPGEVPVHITLEGGTGQQSKTVELRDKMTSLALNGANNLPDCIDSIDITGSGVIIYYTSTETVEFDLYVTVYSI